MADYFDLDALLVAVNFQFVVKVDVTSTVTGKVRAGIKSFAELGERRFDDDFITKKLRVPIELTVLATASCSLRHNRMSWQNFGNLNWSSYTFDG